MYQFTVILEEQPEGVYLVTCQELPELITEGNSIDEALANAEDAFITTLELYEDLNKPLPESIKVAFPSGVSLPSTKHIPVSLDAAKLENLGYRAL